jgi:hypothetical protein
VELASEIAAQTAALAQEQLAMEKAKQERNAKMMKYGLMGLGALLLIKVMQK